MLLRDVNIRKLYIPLDILNSLKFVHKVGRQSYVCMVHRIVDHTTQTSRRLVDMAQNPVICTFIYCIHHLWYIVLVSINDEAHSLAVRTWRYREVDKICIHAHII
jgi:hypothetical protein